ncbi:MAG TPA: DUF4129 domain-containing protein [Candidatus Polarisedimenticolaceae bacterium]
MRLDRVTAVLRPRSPSEAVDLGFTMARTSWKPVWGAMLALCLPIAFLAAAAFRERPWAAWLVVWWLKPLYDAAIQFVLSRLLFGETPGGEALRRAIPSILRGTVLPGLLWRRFAPSRSFAMPVALLEELRGGERWKRFQTLAQDGRGTAMLLMGMCALFELVVAMGAMGFLTLMIPDADGSFWSRFFEEPTSIASRNTYAWVAAASFTLATIAIEPFYAAAGFALYLNRRTWLEAWDVEIAFRRLGARLGRAGVAVLLAVAALAPAAGAAEHSPLPEPETAIREVLADPEFGGTEKVTVLRPRWKPKPSEAEPRDFRFAPWLAEVLEILVWSTAAALIAVLVVAVARAAGLPSFRRAARPPPPPETLFGLDIRAESLPDDPAAEARALWARGERAAALSLLYRASLSRLAVDEGFVLGPAATEGDCVRLVERRFPPALAGFFRRLTRAWQATAYAHRPPDDAEADALLGEWGTHFGAAS